MILTLLSSLLQIHSYLLPVLPDPSLQKIQIDLEEIFVDTEIAVAKAEELHGEALEILLNLAVYEQENEESKPEEKLVQKNNQIDKKNIVAQWFFDTKVDGFSDNWWQGHCTQYAAWYRWKHYDVKIDRRWNANQRRSNAINNGRETWSDPELWAFVVLDKSIGVRTEYWHVWVIVKIDEETGDFMVEDMNYGWEYVVTHRWMSPDEPYILGYIYLPR